MPNAVTNALRVSPVLTHAPTRPDPSFTTPRRTTSGDKTRSSLQVKILFPWFEELVRRQGRGANGLYESGGIQ